VTGITTLLRAFVVTLVGTSRHKVGNYLRSGQANVDWQVRFALKVPAHLSDFLAQKTLLRHTVTQILGRDVGGA